MTMLTSSSSIPAILHHSLHPSHQTSPTRFFFFAIDENITRGYERKAARMSVFLHTTDLAYARPSNNVTRTRYIRYFTLVFFSPLLASLFPNIFTRLYTLLYGFSSFSTKTSLLTGVGIFFPSTNEAILGEKKYEKSTSFRGRGVIFQLWNTIIFFSIFSFFFSLSRRGKYSSVTGNYKLDFCIRVLIISTRSDRYFFLSPDYWCKKMKFFKSFSPKIRNDANEMILLSNRPRR